MKKFIIKVNSEDLNKETSLKDYVYNQIKNTIPTRLFLEPALEQNTKVHLSGVSDQILDSDPEELNYSSESTQDSKLNIQDHNIDKFIADNVILDIRKLEDGLNHYDLTEDDLKFIFSSILCYKTADIILDQTTIDKYKKFQLQKNGTLKYFDDERYIPTKDFKNLTEEKEEDEYNKEAEQIKNIDSFIEKIRKHSDLGEDYLPDTINHVLKKDLLDKYNKQINSFVRDIVEPISKALWIYKKIISKVNNTNINLDNLKNYIKDIENNLDVGDLSSTADLFRIESSNSKKYTLTNQKLLESFGCRKLLFRLGSSLFTKCLGYYQNQFKHKKGESIHTNNNNVKITYEDGSEKILHLDTTDPLTENQIDIICSNLRSEMIVQDLYEKSRLLKNIQLELDLIQVELQNNESNSFKQLEPFFSSIKKHFNLAQIKCLFYIEYAIDYMTKNSFTLKKSLELYSKEDKFDTQTEEYFQKKYHKINTAVQKSLSDLLSTSPQPQTHKRKTEQNRPKN